MVGAEQIPEPMLTYQLDLSKKWNLNKNTRIFTKKNKFQNVVSKSGRQIFRSQCVEQLKHYNHVIMNTMASQITSLTIVYSTVYSGIDQRNHQSSASLDFVRGIHRWQMNSPHKGPVTRKIFQFDDVIMNLPSFRTSSSMDRTSSISFVLQEIYTSSVRCAAVKTRSIFCKIRTIAVILIKFIFCQCHRSVISW